MALSDCTLTDFKGNALTNVLAKNPAGYWIALPAAPSGAQVFSVVGPAATYFTIATDPIMGLGLACTSTPVPDNWDGLLTIRQTDPTDGTHDTPFALSVTSSAGKPSTGIWQFTPTIHWLRRKTVKDVFDAERTLYYDPDAIYAQTVVVTTVAQLNTQIATLAAAADGTSNYRIKCAWNGIQAITNIGPQKFNFGSGYLMIEAEDGYEPCAQLYATQSRNWGGVIFNNIGISSNTTNGINFKFYGSIASGVAYNTRVLFHNCKIGNVPWAAYGASLLSGVWAKFIVSEFAQEIIIEGGTVSGTAKAVIEGNWRLLHYAPDETRRYTGDILGAAVAYNASKPIIVDGNMYTWLEPNLFDSLDNYNPGTAADPLHRDLVQMRPLATPATPITAYFHFENSPACAGGYSYQKDVNATKYATPTVQAFIDSSAGDGCFREVSMFNFIEASDAPRGFWTGKGNLSQAWCSHPASDRRPTANVPTTCGSQRQGSDGDNHIWNCLLATNFYTAGAPEGCVGGGNRKFHVQGSALFDFYNSSTPTTQPDAVVRGEIVPFVRANSVDNYWNYPLNYAQTADGFESDLSRQLHHNAADMASTRGARLRETHVVTPAGGAQVTVTVTP